MAASIVLYETKHEPLVHAFNARLTSGGAWRFRFYESATLEWLAPGQSENAQRECFVAIDEGGNVRGAYCLKSQAFLVGRRPLTIASMQGPVSEGIVNKRYGLVALQLVRDMTRRQPALFMWGGPAVLSGILVRLGWKQFEAPLLIRILRVNRFLRLNRLLRANRKVEIALDFLAAAGLGAVAIHLMQFCQSALGIGSRNDKGRATETARFGSWADDVWGSASLQYAMIAVRDSKTMNALLPAAGWPESTILRVDDGGEVIGWAAVRDTQFKDDARFGNLRVGSIIDSLARPGRETSVVHAASTFLERRQIDIIATNFTAANWIAAFQTRGFFAIRNRRRFTISPVLYQRAGGGEMHGDAVHLTPLDGDGPLGF
jgi:hypothetical protein